MFLLVFTQDSIYYQATILCIFSDVGNQDRVYIQELIKTVAQVNQLESSTQKDFKGIQYNKIFSWKL